MTAADPLVTHRPRKLGPLTALNRATSEAYHACVVNGGHQPSGDTVERVYPGLVRVLPICAVCRVPYGGPKIASWSSGPKRGPKVRE